MTMGLSIRTVLLLAVLPAVLGQPRPCVPRDFDKGSVVCVCNATYCDDMTLPPLTETDVALLVTSTKSGDRFTYTSVKFTPNDDNSTIPEIRINPNQTFQEIIGFGGAFTDSACLNIHGLENTTFRDDVLKAYYSSNGLDYNIGRVPIASCDFSSRVYSYDEVENDFNLTHFALAPEDINLKIPLIQRAQEIRNGSLLLFASPWSSPAWMKTNGHMWGRGSLKGEVGGPYYQTWAEYFLKFLQEYQKHNITFWGLTAQNEPLDGLLPFFPFQCLGFTWETQRVFIEKNLGPTLEKAGFGPDKIKLMILDDMRLVLPLWAHEILKSKEANKYVAGIGFHWYWNSVSPASLLDIAHKMHPDKFLLATEACISAQPCDTVSLGNWERGEEYAKDILDDLLHWTTGWVDWNLALDLNGGPNWVGNTVDAPIIINATAQEFYKQPMYYALAHFTKFLPKGSQRLDAEVPEDIEAVVFQDPEDKTVVIVINRGNEDKDLKIIDPRIGSMTITSPAHSFQTAVWMI